MLWERWRQKNVLVQLDNEVAGSLPATAITDKAKNKLSGWGVPEDSIEKLRSMTALFRYDRCPQKAARIARNGGFLYKYQDRDVIILPDFFEAEKRLDGQCGDIASQLIRALNYSGYLPRLNASLTARSKPRILPIYSIGKSRTHFNSENSTHVWTGLVQEGLAPENQVVVDASFQEISDLVESGYRLEDEPIIDPEQMRERKASVIPLARLIIEGKECRLRNIVGRVILGISPDRKFSYGLGFCRQSSGGEVRPYIGLIRETGEMAKTVCLLDSQGQDIWLGGTDDINQPHQTEVISILRELKPIQIVPDPKKAKRLIEQISTVQLWPTN